MFGYAETLGPEARRIVRYLVSQGRLEDTTPAAELAERLGLEETELHDGIDELVERDIITAHGPYRTHVQPKGGAWLYVDAETLGYDIRRDMLDMAQSTNERGAASYEELQADTGLSQGRLNVAALALEYEDSIQLVKFHGRGGHAFNQARATRRTREFLREKAKAETNLEFGGRYEVLLTNAKELHRQGHHEAAIVIAHTACEVCTDLALKNALSVNKVEHLADPIDGLLRGYNLADDRVRKMYVAVSADSIHQEPFWQSFKEHSKRRNNIVHHGHKATAEESDNSIRAVEAVIRHLTIDTP
jgi:DNA-binding Lrp family transcriptional regulator